MSSSDESKPPARVTRFVVGLLIVAAVVALYLFVVTRGQIA